MDLRSTAIVSLYSINWLAYITGTECVYCAVRGHSWIVIMINVSSRRPGFDPRPIRVRFVLNGVALWQVFLPVLWFSRQYHSTNTPHSPSSTCCSYQKDKRAQPGNLQKQCCFVNRKTLGRKNLSLYSFCYWLLFFAKYSFLRGLDLNLSINSTCNTVSGGSWTVCGSGQPAHPSGDIVQCCVDWRVNGHTVSHAHSVLTICTF